MERKKFWLNDMEAVLGIVAVLIILGTINVFSSSFIISENNYNTPYYFLRHHFVNLSIAIVCGVVGWRIDYHRWRNIMPVVIGVTLFSLIAVLLFGVAVNGSKRWLNLYITQVQPAEWAKLVSILLASAYLSSAIKKGESIRLMPLQIWVIALMAGLVELEPDMGTACFIAGVPIIMFALSGLSRQKLYGLIGVAGAALAGLCTLQPYRLERLRVMLDPWADAQNIGYQVVQSMSAIGSGGFWGMGLGMGISKYDYLPEAHTDFAFAVLCQENGFLGALLVFLRFAALAFYAGRIANSAKDIFGQMLALGIMLLLVGQAAVNILMVGGIGPVVGVPLPFISYGGTSLFVSIASIGILMNIGEQAIKARREGTRTTPPPEKPAAPRLYLVKK